MIAGVALVTKLRKILLMEANFNFHNKLIFGKRTLNLAREHNLVPDKVSAIYGCLDSYATLHRLCYESHHLNFLLQDY